MFKLGKVCKKKIPDTGKGMFARDLSVFLSQNYKKKKKQLIVIYGKSVDDRLNDVGDAELIVSIRYTCKCFKI